LLLKRDGTKNIPIILYSMLEQPKNLPKNLPSNVAFVPKVHNTDDLIEQIRSLTKT
jgi:hypothetical protein